MIGAGTFLLNVCVIISLNIDGISYTDIIEHLYTDFGWSRLISRLRLTLLMRYLIAVGTVRLSNSLYYWNEGIDPREIQENRHPREIQENRRPREIQDNPHPAGRSPSKKKMFFVTAACTILIFICGYLAGNGTLIHFTYRIQLQLSIYYDAALIRRLSVTEPYECVGERLELAMDMEEPIIVIEPFHLGEVTAMWIRTGGFLRETALFSAFSSMFCFMNYPSRYLTMATPMAVTGVIFKTLYSAVWKLDPCGQYQIETNPVKLANLPTNKPSSNALVLVRQVYWTSTRFHTVMAAFAVGLCGWKFYKNCM